MDTIVGPLTDQLVARILPQMKDMVARAAEGAEPTIRKVVIEEVLPKFGAATVLGMVAGAIGAAAIGSWFATRR